MEDVKAVLNAVIACWTIPSNEPKVFSKFEATKIEDFVHKLLLNAEKIHQ